MRPLSSGWKNLFRKGTQSQELSALRRELKAEHTRLAVNLRAAHDLLAFLPEAPDQPGFDDLLLGYKTLIAIVERENFIDMPVERLAVVVAQVASRLERLGQMLRDMQSRGRARTSTTLH